MFMTVHFIISEEEKEIYCSEDGEMQKTYLTIQKQSSECLKIGDVIIIIDCLFMEVEVQALETWAKSTTLISFAFMNLESL